MIFVAILISLVWLATLALLVCGTFWAKQGLNEDPPHLDAPFGLYPVSVLKPLKGADNGLAQNLRTFFELDYPEYELLFSISDARDPARSVVENLMGQYPRIRARLIVGGVEAGVNPKVNNLIRSFEFSAHDLVVISDSNVRVAPDYLKRLVAHLDTDVGVITAVVAGRGAESLGGKLEAMFLNTFYARWMHVTARLGKACVVGKSMLLRKSTAARFGGIKTLARYLAEDYMTGIAMQYLNLKVVIMSDPVEQHIGSYSVQDFWQRHVRWGRIRKSQAPVAFFFEPYFGVVAAGILGAIGWGSLAGIPMLPFFFAHLSVAFVCDAVLSARLEKGRGQAWQGFRLSVLGVWLLREFLAVPLWLHTAIGSTVLWRGRRLKLEAGGLLSVQ